MTTSPLAPVRRADYCITLTLTGVTLLCGLFLLLDVPIRDWFVLAGRWLPALVCLVVLRLVPLPGGLGHWWQLRPGGWSECSAAPHWRSSSWSASTRCRWPRCH